MSRDSWCVIGLLLLFAGPARGQEGRLQAELRLEAEHLKEDCGSLKGAPGCAATLVTGHPLHVALGSIAPQNGFGFGPALSLHFTPDEQWRHTWSSDAVFTPGGAWRAGTYFKAIHTNVELPQVVRGGAPSGPLIRTTEYPTFSGHAQMISLPKLSYYGLGANSAEADETTYGLRELIVGGGATLPLTRVAQGLRLAGLFEANWRTFDIQRGTKADTPQITDRFDGASVPGLGTQPAYLQLGEGVRVKPMLLNDRLQLNYAVQWQQFVASQAGYSFRRWTLNLNHDVPIYRTGSPTVRRDTNTPNECSASPQDCSCPGVTRDRWGTLGFRFLASKSQVGSTSAVPFYVQRTLGGSDIDGVRALASYADYRFRGPHVLLLQESLEHAVWGPIGAFLQADQGKVASQTDGLSFRHLRHSVTIGTTLRAGGFPVLTGAVGVGGREGRHVIVTLDTSLLGGGGRPALQ